MLHTSRVDLSFIDCNCQEIVLIDYDEIGKPVNDNVIN